MFKTYSIRKVFLIKLFISLLSLIIIFSSTLYFFIEKSIYDNKHQELIKYAKNIVNNKTLWKMNNQKIHNKLLALNIKIVHLKQEKISLDFYEKTKNNHTYLTLFYPLHIQDKSYLKITKDITPTKQLLKTILHYIFLTNIISFALVIIYAIALSKMLIAPIWVLNKKLANMNEQMITPIKIHELPQEFQALGETINHLISRIHNFIKYQKELFIGTAHELKTPLAVIKLKNQVTLMKERTPKEYIEALKVTNKTVDEMNIIVSNILNVGRQEGAQLDKPVEVDVIKLLQEKANDFVLLAKSEEKILEINLQPNSFMATIQISLLNQILQNFLQNALKFTPKQKKVTLQSYLDDVGLCIEVIDEGCGIDESVDLFAPFKRQGNKSGVGLGLFLAKSAADALGAEIKLQNRQDGKDGTIASLQLRSNLSCILPKR
ncbi:Sensor kinase cusS [hydrothermal vent metagenome]|uniref:histidine kinase n=1 Tax=hydrothermal vent metagenome TaxID=652676 RepID=A0A1W1D269_9ZZZZ